MNRRVADQPPAAVHRAEEMRRNAQLLELLESINQYRLPTLGSDHDSMLLYDQHRLCRDSLLDLTISTCIETENAIRMLAAVIKAVDYLVDETEFKKLLSNLKIEKTIFEAKTCLLNAGISNHTELIVVIKMLIRKKCLECRNLQEQVRKKSYYPE